MMRFYEISASLPGNVKKTDQHCGVRVDFE